MIGVRVREGSRVVPTFAGCAGLASFLTRRDTTGKWLPNFICPVRLGRCNSLLCDASNNGVCLKFSSGEAARTTVLLRHIRQESKAATHGDVCASSDALYTRTQRQPSVETSLLGRLPKAKRTTDGG
jgi:hypothetical protein